MAFPLAEAAAVFPPSAFLSPPPVFFPACRRSAPCLLDASPTLSTLCRVVDCTFHHSLAVARTILDMIAENRSIGGWITRLLVETHKTLTLPFYRFRYHIHTPTRLVFTYDRRQHYTLYKYRFTWYRPQEEVVSSLMLGVESPAAPACVQDQGVLLGRVIGIVFWHYCSGSMCRVVQRLPSASLSSTRICLFGQTAMR